ncbi:acyl-CoA dehydrogenase [Crossiella equi]|uniref:Acyl-CoA dehydrogenase n=1 Tax=Crossiella equi TaxID=130796 RepID=A0ABS5A8Y3_9PSEU|nr:acyl-CoA dehydrogenase family protein [Crossiella equi]MBP2473054.1 acyl-CoA dehydrogenase [Crossiella equi]
MDFTPTEAQTALSELTRTILTRELTPARLSEADQSAHRFDCPLWTLLAEAGLLGLGVPEALGGSGHGVLEQCAVLHELGRAVAPVPYLAHTVATATLAAHGGTAWLPRALSGEAVYTVALTESAATTADPTPDGWLLNGTKTAVPHGLLADLFLVPATTPEGPRLFAVTPTDPGVTLERQDVVDGDQEALLDLSGTPLPADRQLTEGAHTFAHDRTLLAWSALQLGTTERALELTADHARTRIQFDRPIGQFQAVAQRLADAYVDVAAVRLTLWQAAWRVSEGLPASESLATAKFWAADAGHRVAHTAVHVHGGVGIDVTHSLHRYFVAAKRAEFALGGATEQLRVLGAELVRQAGPGRQ